ncbi:MAG TPA: pyridoxamine 5'-phosphate oxidase family protein [Pseudonocardia sp.]|nr:pyridoxamine 5'-phosphate oxidase family protein [Pseudonocardia sp.]
MRPLTVDERERFLAEPRVAVLSVASDDDRPPLTVPVWYAYRPGGRITILTGTQGRRVRKTRLLEKAGVLSLNVQRAEFPYRFVTVEGTLLRADPAPEAAEIEEITRRYLPPESARGLADAEVAQRSDTFVLFTVRPDRWIAFDFSDDQPS